MIPELDRRAFLRFFGTTAALGLGGAAAPAGEGPRAQPWVRADGTLDWDPVRLPLPSHGDGGEALTDARDYARYVVEDTLVLPEGFRFDVVASWGERFGPPDARGVRFGFNADYTGLVPMQGREDEYWLLVNHEYISARPWLQGYEAVWGEALPDVRIETDPLSGRSRLRVGDALLPTRIDFDDAAEVGRLPAEAVGSLRELGRRALEELGVSVLHVRRDEDGRFEVVRDSTAHRRITGLDPRTPTFSNCSGGTTPWGTFLTCEENVQDQLPVLVDARGEPLSGDRRPFEVSGTEFGFEEPSYFDGLYQLLEPRLDPRRFGWVGHVDPVSGTMEKLEALGRFRHENVALRCEPERPVAAYMGDDRRGGHIWKFVSAEVVEDPTSAGNVALLREGHLYAARFHPDETGTWIAIEPETPLARPTPEHCADGFLWLPDRRPRDDGGTPGGYVAVAAGGARRGGSIAPDAWVRSIEEATGRPFAEATLGDLVLDPEGDALAAPERAAHRRRVLRLDAFAMANAAGATPSARPEDLEIHPGDGAVFVAFTDATGSGTGSPDARVFRDSDRSSSRQYGGIFRLEEEDGDPGAARFRWSVFVTSGELADGGGAFACADNLAFDPAGNLWFVCDISTERHNHPVDRAGATGPGQSRFRGVFGNNGLFCVPTAGPLAGRPQPFAIGPTECELTGLTFSPDGETLILSVQHPGEFFGTRGGPGRPSEVERTLKLAARDGSVFEQTRVVPLGSNFPSSKRGDAPRPCVVCITRSR